MTSKIKVDNINKVSDDSNIINKCGDEVTVGAASDGLEQVKSIYTQARWW